MKIPDYNLLTTGKVKALLIYSNIYTSKNDIFYFYITQTITKKKLLDVESFVLKKINTNCFYDF